MTTRTKKAPAKTLESTAQAKKVAAKPKKGAAKASVRPLVADDLETVIRIDEANVGRSRRGFLEKRLAAVKRDPKMFLALAVEDGGALAGFLIARIFRGEFGTSEPVASIDALGVDGSRQGHGYGSALIAGLEELMRKKGIREVMSQDLWSSASVMRFLAASGFELAPRWVLERRLDEPIDF